VTKPTFLLFLTMFFSIDDQKYDPGVTILGGESYSSELPSQWRNLPSLALPDGSHNHTQAPCASLLLLFYGIAF
jgi:hypothetical protein